MAEQLPDSGEGQAMRSDSDSDSDFVCLENASRESSHESSEERVIIPLRLSHSNSSIRPNFNFLQDAGAHREDDEDDDGGEETESSTEEGIDDRIESEQSEAGSEPQMNEVGDLSFFGDIGDLPLVAGDVARNYIHRPNQHVTTILNTIVVLAAFLTMGLSLGIMMATDLEIEEWQTAYDIQTRKVADLQNQLVQQRLKFDQSTSLQQSLYTQMVETKRKELQQTQNDYRGYVDALELMSTYESEDPQFISLMQSVQTTIKAIARCNTIGQRGWMKAPFCYMENQAAVEALKAKLSTFSQSSGPDMPQQSTLHTKGGTESSHHTVNQSGTESVGDLVLEQDVMKKGRDSAKDRRIESNQDDSGTESKPESNGLASNDIPKEDTAIQMDERSDTLAQSLKTETDTSEQLSDLRKSESPGIYVSLPQIDSRLGESGTPEFSKAETSMSTPDQQQLSQEPKGAREKEADQMCIREDNGISHKSTGGEWAQQSIPLDIHQLQQSLSREQERALHWQQLYLAERRQREHERESEMWEDQRDRERWERERERSEQVECLHKLMAANISTLTQYLTGWNISVYDDFANLSMLMSSVAELRQSVLNSVHKLGEGAEEIFHKIRLEGEDRLNSVNWGEALATKDVIIQYVDQLFKDVEKGVNDVLQENVDKQENSETEDPSSKDQGKASDQHEREERSEGFGDGRHAKDKSNWAKGLEKFIHQTRKSVGKVGKKMTTIVRHLRNLWTKQKPVLSTMARDIGTKFVKITEKFIKHLNKDLHLKLFKKSPNHQNTGVVDIHSEVVRDLRHRWQGRVLKYPCQVLGDYSAECNMKKRTRRRKIKAVNEDLKGLLKLRVNRSPQKVLLKMGKTRVKRMPGKFMDFVENWQDSKFVMLADVRWAKCQVHWWTRAEKAMLSRSLDTLHDNKCDLIDLSTAVDGGTDWLWGDEDDESYLQAESVCFDDNLETDQNEKKDHKDDRYVGENEREKASDDVETEVVTDFKQTADEEEVLQTVRMEPEELDPRFLVDPENKNSKANFTIVSSEEISSKYTHSTSYDDESWSHEQARLRLHIRREKEKARRETGKKIRTNLKQSREMTEEQSGDWLFKKAEDRQHQREEAQRAQWLFERARHRRHDSDEKRRTLQSIYTQSEVDEEEDDDEDDDEEDFEHLPNWFLKQAKERQRLRKKEHQSDWLFERASDRRKEHHLWKEGKREHKEWRNHKGVQHSKKDHHRYTHGKQHFRHSYGRVVTP